MLIAAMASTLACRQDMHDQPRYKPLANSEFFDDRRAARPLPPGAVARGHLKEDAVFFTGKDGADFTPVLPLPVTMDLLRRGQLQFHTFCSPCHGRTGRGDGMVVQRGFKKPPSFHVERLRQTPVGYFYDVITNGFGAMPDYAAQVPPRERWAIVAYVRALQLSQHARLQDVPAEKRAELERSVP
jgi:mono/diheme cytochrome c family protein